MTPILQASVANENETAAFAKSLGAILKAQDIVTLNGTLGAGKTAFARALIRGLCGETTEVTSPTFNLLLTYDSERGPIYHYDFYRLEDPEEVWELDIEEAYDIGITLIEWVSNLQDLAPEMSLDVTISIPEGGDEGARVITLTGPEKWQDRLRNLTD